jgi:hypothetical protein
MRYNSIFSDFDAFGLEHGLLELETAAARQRDGKIGAKDPLPRKVLGPA